MADYVITVSAEEGKALLTDMISVQAWLDNAIHNKARRCMDKVCQDALEQDGILTEQEKREVMSTLAAQGRIISTVKQMPESVKADVVRKARVESAAERQAKEEETSPR